MRAVLLLIVVVPVILIGDNPGMYFDAVYDDYYAVQLLHPQEHSAILVEFLPFLGQLRQRDKQSFEIELQKAQYRLERSGDD